MLAAQCFGQVSNLSFYDFLKNLQSMKNTLDTTGELYSLVKRPNQTWWHTL